MKSEIKYLETKTEKYPFIYTLNVMEAIQLEYGSIGKWSDLIENGNEPDIRALIFFFKEAINEGIEIENENNESNRSLVDMKKVGRIITEIGINNAGTKLKDMIIASSGSDKPTEKTEETVDESKN